MAAQLGRWLKYAQAKLDGALRSGEKELDRLELEREAELAERPWLADDGAAPSIEATRARIEWEAEEARRRAEVADAAGTGPGGAPVAAPSGTPSPDQPPTGAGIDPARPAGMPDAPDPADPEVEAARMELDRQARESKERLEAIRAELGVAPDAPDAGTPA